MILFKARIIILFFILGLAISCSGPGKPFRKVKQPKSTNIDLPEIRERNKLIVLTNFNATDYFIYRGKPMGYQYDLIHELADALEIDFEIVVENNLEKSFDYLESGRVDLLALNLTITKERSKFLRFTDPHTKTRQILVQRKPENWEELRKESIDISVIRNQLDLAGKTIYVQKNSSFSSRLHNLSEEIGDSIHIVETDETVETLISKVVSGEIDYTVCDENMARVNQTFYPIIDIQTAISFPQRHAWAVRKNDTMQLFDTINYWLKNFKKTGKYANIYNRYFKNPKTGLMANSGMIYVGNGILSPYDSLIRQYSDSLSWDWRLLASMIYQESGFLPNAVSWVGAFGLMQLMPSTANYYRVTKNSIPERNIEAGVKYLQWLDEIFQDKVTYREERLKFVLGSYNVGLGHVLDARALARKYDKDPEIWDDNVEIFLLKKSDPKYYLDPVVRFGYCRGQETYDYVRKILARYDDYKNIIALN
ncbi:MAG: transporter substrate-binding domain-containing protein [Bacteroidales bacterium]|nr:transporter substrate-binding domain-containing protein [Bacteroidales bacterium]